MTNELEPYPVYKDSGVPWLGQVPEQWDIKRNKLFLREVNQCSEDGTEELLTVSQYTGVTRRRERSLGEGDLLTHATSLVGHKRVSPGDLVVNIMLAWNGSLGVSSLAGIVSPAYCVYRASPQSEPRFLHYLYRTPLFTGAFKTVSTGVVDSRLRLYPDVFFGMSSLLPPLPEQAAIVRYLDHADRKVRHAIRARQQLIKLLTEQKQAIINRAVTRGLDPNVRLKPSGVSWLGDVPDHWEVLPLKRVSRVQGGYAFSSSLFDDHGVPIVRMTNLKSGRLELAGAPCVPESECMDRFSARAGDLLYGLSGSIGNFGVVRDEDLPVQINQRVGRFVPLLSRISGSYLALVVQTPEFSRQVLDMCTGTAQLNVSPLDVERVVITVPSLPEQTAILGYAHDATAILDKAIYAARREIDLLREYRTRLIADVVTGKLDVRSAAAVLPAEAREATEDLESCEEDVLDLSDTCLEEPLANGETGEAR